MANYKLTELDFDDIKTNLKDFLRTYKDDSGNSIFTDYEFEGSGLSVLIDLLAYNTHYNAYLANMLANELFLDSAVKRESVVSLAKHLGYTPLSTRSAKATINFTVTNPVDFPRTLTLPRYTVFNNDIGGNLLSFVNVEPITIEPVNGQYLFSNVQITEGAPLEYTFRVNSPGPDEKYEIPNDSMDTTTMYVTVQNSTSDTQTTVYSLVEDMTIVGPSSNVYYLEENFSGRYQIYFGDGILGRKLLPGNIVRVEYLVSRGSDGNVSENFVQNFTTGQSVGGGIITNITTVSNSTGGGLRDKISDIRFKAPKFLSSFNRAVTSSDYKALIEANYPFIESVSVWGGDENTPPVYGKVFIALKPYNGYQITYNTKETIKKYVLENKKVMSIIPEVVDPEYIYIGINSTITYNTKLSALLPNQVKALVNTSIQDYFKNDLQKFDKDFVFSKLSRQIDNTDRSIIGNITKVKIQKRLTPILGIRNELMDFNAIRFNNPLMPGTLLSTRFIIVVPLEEGTLSYVPVIIKDIPDNNPALLNGTGTTILYNPDTFEIVNTNYGKINYGTGIISLSGLNVYGYPEDTAEIRLTAEPQNFNIKATKNQILVIDDSTLMVPANRLAGLTINVETAFE